ncbi:MAG: hypothetical protein GF313_04915, partial [Caldithrix sp.]|nr:hypothetical protein [Caldithrix sp.]
AMHQANYLPWIGYFYKMMQSDVFVYLDNVQYPRGQSFAARNRIKTPNGPSYLTVPISLPKGQKGKASYREVGFSDERWKDKHLKSVSLNYKKAPFFDEVMALYEGQLSKSHDALPDLNMDLIEAIADYLSIDTKRVRLSQLLKDHGQKTELIIDICQALPADAYLSGTGGGKAYNDEQQLQDAGIELLYSDFKHPVYNQLWGDFVSHLSIIDLLFNHGKESTRIIGEAH